MASLEGNGDTELFNLTTKVDAKKNLQLSSCQSSPNKRKDSLGRIEKYKTLSYSQYILYDNTFLF